MSNLVKRNIKAAWSHARMYGWWSAGRFSVARLLTWTPDDAFDRIHGTETSGVLSMPGDEQPKAGQVVRSISTHPKILKYIFGHLGIDHRDFVCIDFGCGKGRALLVASEFPFRKIVGVEWSQDLCVVARENIGRYRSNTQQCRDIEVCCMDVLSYPLPASDMVIFMYNPFGMKLITDVFDRIGRHGAASPHRLLIVFAGLGGLEAPTVMNCFERNGIDVVQKNTALNIMGSWVLGEVRGAGHGG